ncbi:MAG: ribonuclease HI [Deltaproteobacteria bacterium]|nr:ribonuclease HI [Deltaproteobacteria bacterium]MBW1929299.1 ribonuclease HI [Deltaproteobacteria bacterium]MBW2024776.1 ribonuclease HI [Deltaproteobacteria bacterium]MBW2124915.1 ribonuclease HI [Deltaproteobacteria bacterium]
MKKAKNKVAPGVVEIFLDGACQGNPGPGGYAAILRFGGSEKEITGCHPQTTNNRMELMAAIKALEQLSRPCKVRIYTDSNYLVKGMTSWLFQWEKNNWKNARKRPVLNRDLWEKLLELSRTHNIEWHWIKGHFGHPENERCDMLAKKAIKKCITTAWHKKKEEL